MVFRSQHLWCRRSQPTTRLKSSIKKFKPHFLFYGLVSVSPISIFLQNAVKYWICCFQAAESMQHAGGCRHYIGVEFNFQGLWNHSAAVAHGVDVGGEVHPEMARHDLEARARTLLGLA